MKTRAKVFHLNAWLITRMLTGKPIKFRCITPLPEDARITQIVPGGYNPDVYNVFVESSEFPEIEDGEPLQLSELNFTDQI